MGGPGGIYVVLDVDGRRQTAGVQGRAAKCFLHSSWDAGHAVNGFPVSGAARPRLAAGDCTCICHTQPNYVSPQN